jgi:hypothetical protein
VPIALVPAVEHAEQVGVGLLLSPAVDRGQVPLRPLAVPTDASQAQMLDLVACRAQADQPDQALDVLLVVVGCRAGT